MEVPFIDEEKRKEKIRLKVEQKLRRAYKKGEDSFVTLLSTKPMSVLAAEAEAEVAMESEPVTLIRCDTEGQALTLFKLLNSVAIPTIERVEHYERDVYIYFKR